jgi:peptidylprolyl isomerase
MKRLVLICAIATLSCRDRDDRSKIRAPDDKAKPSAANLEPTPETPMTLTNTPGLAAIAPPTTVKRPPADAFVSSTGLATKRLVVGTGARRPGPNDKVKVHYTGWTTDGKMFDSSILRGSPAQFPVNALIKGFSEGLQQMVVGEQRRFWIPGALAYGDDAGGGRPAGMLVFDVALLELEPASP